MSNIGLLVITLSSTLLLLGHGSIIIVEDAKGTPYIPNYFIIKSFDKLLIC